MDQLRKRQPDGQDHSGKPDYPEKTDTMNSIPDPHSLPLEQIWETEWKKHMVEVALNRLKDRLKPEHVQLFYLTVIEHLGVRKVAAMLGMTTTQVYLVRHRVAKLLKKEIQLISENQ